MDVTAVPREVVADGRGVWRQERVDALVRHRTSAGALGDCGLAPLIAKAVVERLDLVEDLVGGGLGLLARRLVDLLERSGVPYFTVTVGNWPFLKLRTCEEPRMAVGTIGAPVCSAIAPMPHFAFSDRSAVRERPPSQYMTIAPPRPRMVRAASIARVSRWPRRTGNVPPRM